MMENFVTALLSGPTMFGAVLALVTLAAAVLVIREAEDRPVPVRVRSNDQRRRRE